MSEQAKGVFQEANYQTWGLWKRIAKKTDIGERRPGAVHAMYMNIINTYDQSVQSQRERR